MPTVREQILELIRTNVDADYWEKIVLRFAEALLAHVDEHLRGIPVQEAGLEKMTVDEFENVPGVIGPIELLDGIPTPKRWPLYDEGLRRLGFANIAEENDAMEGKWPEVVEAEYQRRREALRNRPFVASQVPFPRGPPEED